ncbi:MAG: YceI family protein [gamma proteobacterium symbiont of Lucinoma myriamae]|nr:YceI family protein [gamma proteobacterium symbiont of Lucinoma myriamae]MCU7817747.1 YceI family protein [gamma proteobacterium symbiont of Lucinoma myriamae]MCU7831734.1 YceI family protein [gamma proteobacterium symbiont of Lucinoma myriamae]
MKQSFLAILFASLIILSFNLSAADYQLDTKDAHAFIQFKIKHLGYSWLVGRFNKFDGNFSYDEKNPAASKAAITIDMASVDSNHAERDKHLRGKDFFEVNKYPQAKFISTSFTEGENGQAILQGELTLHGVTKKVSLMVDHIGNGADPWGGYRRGFSATTKLSLKDYNINFNLGPESKEVELFISVEGIKK